MVRPAVTLPLTYPTQLVEQMEADIARSLREHGTHLKTIFRKVEALWMAGSEYQGALGFVADRTLMAQHREVIDFLFCELFPEHLERCTDFLNDRGQQLNEFLTAEQLRRCEHAMFCVMVIATALRRDCPEGVTCPVSWNAILEFARALAAQTYVLAAPAPSH